MIFAVLFWKYRLRLFFWQMLTPHSYCIIHMLREMLSNLVNVGGVRVQHNRPAWMAGRHFGPSQANWRTVCLDMTQCVCVCVCVCGPCAVCRCLSEDNQTASIDNFLHKYEGLYRCMAHGHSGDVITNDVRLEAQGQTEFAVHTVHAASHVNVKNT